MATTSGGRVVRSWRRTRRRGADASPAPTRGVLSAETPAHPGQLLLVVGVQKSGTTLLVRLLEQSGMAASPFRSEGDDFWGNVPSFSPTGHPAGTVYQRDGGASGHEIGPDDATADVRDELERRLRALPRTSAPVLVNKNPFNTLRLPWLRALLPDARIVAMVRSPVPNVFSLLKKHTPHKGAGLAPEDGWWGVKPRGWRDHAGDDLLSKCSWQWSEVNQKLAADRACLDEVISYHELCRAPSEVVERVLGQLGRGPIAPLAPVRCFDDEFRRGARLRSKNREYLETNSLEVPDGERIEIEALDAAACEAVEAACAPTRSLFPELA